MLKSRFSQYLKLKHAGNSGILLATVASVSNILMRDKPKQLALSFAMAVSVPSPNPHDWIARKGEDSLFQAFHQMLPEVRS